MIPLPFVAQHLPITLGAEDAHGNPVETWGPATDMPCTWWSPSSTEPALAGHDRVIVDLVIVLDAEVAALVDHRDRFAVEGRTYSVQGLPEDYDHGPFGWSPKRRALALKRVEG